MWYQGLAQLSTMQTILTVILFLHLTTVSVTLYLHRFSAHRALQLHPGLQHLFRCWLWLTTGMSTKEWTAVHRKHHATCETEQDPHSPVFKGLKTVLWRGTELYQQAVTPQTLEKYGKGTPDDLLERRLYRHSGLGISLMLAIDLLLFGVIGITVWAIQMLWIPVTAAGIINGLGHACGYRNFECPDASRNIVPWGILIGGEELHNNHHTYPNSPKLAVKRWELDLGWYWIRLFSALGLAQVNYHGPLAERIPGKHRIDLDTAWGALNDRFQIMAHYSRQVVSPLIKDEKSRIDKRKTALLKRAKFFISGERSLWLDRPGVMQEVKSLLAQHPDLMHIYEMRKALQDIWHQGAHNMNGMMLALQEWCQRAEASQIKALHEFADYLRSYSIPATITARA
mgnify:CR=1 FL=1